MNLRNYLDVKRLLLLLKMEFFRSRKGMLMTLVITFGVVVAGVLLETVVEHKKAFESHEDNFTFALIMGGFIVSSHAFNDLSNNLKRYNYLTLPASTFEKFFSMWLLTSLGWTVFFTIVYLASASISNTIGHLLYPQVLFHAFNPLAEKTWIAMRFYFVLHGIFLVGAAHFRGFVFGKTIFTLILAATGLGIMGYIFLADLFLFDHECSAGECELLTEIKGNKVWAFSKYLFWWLLAPLCWVVTYTGLKEKEA